MLSEVGVPSSDDPGLALPSLPAGRVDLAALSVLDGAKLRVHLVDLVPIDTTGPDVAPVAEVHGLGSGEDAGQAQAALVLAALVPAGVWHRR